MGVVNGQDCDCDLHCTKCSVEVLLEVTYGDKKAQMLREGEHLHDEDGELPVMVTSMDLEVVPVSQGGREGGLLGHPRPPQAAASCCSCFLMTSVGLAFTS